MGKGSKISWTDHTFNPWWGCVKVSPGCQGCYAEAFSKRTGHDVWGAGAPRRFFSEKHWTGPDSPVAWNREAEKAGRRALVFCSSMADVFEIHEDVTTNDAMNAERLRLWKTIEATPWLIWLLLTKRPENIARLVPDTWLGGHEFPCMWPENVWVGTSVEDAHPLRLARVDALRQVPAPVRFLSCEPLLGDVAPALDLMGISWVIAGGESGGKARACRVEWVQNLRDLTTSVPCSTCRGNGWVIYHPPGSLGDSPEQIECPDCQGDQGRGVAFHFKQWGEWAPDFDVATGLDTPESMSRVGVKAAGYRLDGREWREYPHQREMTPRPAGRPL